MGILHLVIRGFLRSWEKLVLKVLSFRRRPVFRLKIGKDMTGSIMRCLGRLAKCLLKLVVILPVRDVLWGVHVQILEKTEETFLFTRWSRVCFRSQSTAVFLSHL